MRKIVWPYPAGKLEELHLPKHTKPLFAPRFNMVVPWSPGLYDGGVAQIIQESGPPRGNVMVQITYKKLSLHAEIKLLKVEMLYIRIYYNKNDNNML
jgi:hypothetical protein